MWMHIDAGIAKCMYWNGTKGKRVCVAARLELRSKTQTGMQSSKEAQGRDASRLGFGRKPLLSCVAKSEPAAEYYTKEQT